MTLCFRCSSFLSRGATLTMSETARRSEKKAVPHRGVRRVFSATSGIAANGPGAPTLLQSVELSRAFPPRRLLPFGELQDESGQQSLDRQFAS